MTRRRGVAAVLIVLALLVLLPCIGAAVFLASLDPATVRQRVIAEVQRATGRQLSVGALRLRLLPELTIDADDVALANPPGFSRAAMLTARHLSGRVALLPLLSHRVVVRALVLSGTDLKLEQPEGLAPNWRFTPAPRPAGPARPAAAGATPRLRLDRLDILGLNADGVVAWQSPSGSGSVAVQDLRLQEINASSTMSLAAVASVGGEAVKLAGRFGGQNHLWNAQDRSDWPVALTLTADAGAIDVKGTISQPRTLQGYDLSIKAHGSDLGRLFLTWPSLPVPRLRDVVLDTQVIDRRDAQHPDGIDIPRLTLTAGQSDLAALVGGLRLNELAITAPNIDGTNGTQVNHVRAAGEYAGQALAVDATLGPVGRLFGRGQVTARTPITLDAMATAAGGVVRVSGRVSPTGDWSGTDASVKATIPDLAALSSLARRQLPGLRDISLSGSVQSARGVLSLVGAHLSLPQAELWADGRATLGGRARYDGRLRIARLDLDALLAAMAARIPAPPTPEAPSAAGPAPAAPAAAPAPASRWIISDRALSFDALRRFDADVSVSADTVTWRRVPLTALSAVLRLDNGRLQIGPAGVRLGSAAVTGSLLIDAAQQPPALALTLAAPGLDAATVASLLGGGGDASGTLDLNAALTGSGASAHAVAATLHGRLGMALTNGALANRLLVRGLGLVTSVGQLPLSLPSDGRSDIACLATGLELRQGIAVPQAFLLDTRRLRLAVAGAIDLRDETFALRLRPYIQLGGTGLVLPSRADGSWRAPRLTLEAASGAASAAALVNTLVGHDAGLNALLEGLTRPADGMLGLADSGDCGPALKAARDISGAMPVLAPVTPAPKSRRDRVSDILKKLFR